jgi:uncharacterized protein YdcH (DUF465 family)
MKWLKSTTQKAWVVSCKGRQAIIPPCETPDNRWLKVGDDEYAEIIAAPVIASLLKAGGIMKLDEEPAELKNSVPALQVTNTQLQAENETLKARIKELEGQLQNATNIDIEAIKADAVAAVKAEMEQALTQEKQKYAELESEAKTVIAEKDKTIEKLEKKLKKEE